MDTDTITISTVLLEHAARLERNAMIMAVLMALGLIVILLAGRKKKP